MLKSYSVFSTVEFIIKKTILDKAERDFNVFGDEFSDVYVCQSKNLNIFLLSYLLKFELLNAIFTVLKTFLLLLKILHNFKYLQSYCPSQGLRLT